MHYAVCLTGFIRDKEFITNIRNLYKIIKNINKISIFYSCPIFINPDDNDKLNKNEIMNLFNSIILEFKDIETKLYIEFRDYNNKYFIDKVYELNLTNKLKNNYHPYRIISNIYGFSKTSSLLLKELKNNNLYDFIIYTRLDIINHIYSINNVFKEFTLKNENYILRSYPNDPNEVEDRFFICSNESIEELSKMYLNIDDAINYFGKNYFTSEKIIFYFLNKMDHIKNYQIKNIEYKKSFLNYQKKKNKIKK